MKNDLGIDFQIPSLSHLVVAHSSVINTVR